MKKIKRSVWLDSIYARCAHGHANIGTNSPVLGGRYIKNTTITVAEILSRIYAHGSIRAATEYNCDVDDEQVKEALSYALTFIEVACDAIPFPGSRS